MPETGKYNDTLKIRKPADRKVLKNHGKAGR